MALPKDGIGKLAAAIVESAVETGKAGLVLLNRDGTDLNTKKVVTKSITLNVNNTTGSINVATITGSVRILKLYGIVTTVLSANVTAAHLRMNDGTNTPVVTASAGTTLSAATVGSMISKVNGVAGAIVLDNASQVRVHESAANHPSFQDFAVIQKNGSTSTLEFRYTTTDAPSSGVIKFFIEYEPLSDDGAVTAV